MLLAIPADTFFRWRICANCISRTADGILANADLNSNRPVGSFRVSGHGFSSTLACWKVR
jgi:hypothetical protein